MGAQGTGEGTKPGRIYVPLDPSMTDDEVVAALREAAGLEPNPKPSVDTEGSRSTPPDEAIGE